MIAPTIKNHWVPKAELQYSAAAYGAYPAAPMVNVHRGPSLDRQPAAI